MSEANQQMFITLAMKSASQAVVTLDQGRKVDYWRLKSGPIISGALAGALQSIKRLLNAL